MSVCVSLFHANPRVAKIVLVSSVNLSIGTPEPSIVTSWIVQSGKVVTYSCTSMIGVGSPVPGTPRIFSTSGTPLLANADFTAHCFWKPTMSP